MTISNTDNILAFNKPTYKASNLALQLVESAKKKRNIIELFGRSYSGGVARENIVPMMNKPLVKFISASCEGKEIGYLVNSVLDGDHLTVPFYYCSIAVVKKKYRKADALKAMLSVAIENYGLQGILLEEDRLHSLRNYYSQFGWTKTIGFGPGLYILCSPDVLVSSNFVPKMTLPKVA